MIPNGKRRALCGLSASLPTAPLFQRIDMALDKALVYLIACNAG